MTQRTQDHLITSLAVIVGALVTVRQTARWLNRLAKPPAPARPYSRAWYQ